MSVLVWIANHALWISLAGALCAIIVRFEKLLPKRLHRFILAFSLFVGLTTPLLGLLKKSVDDQWKTEMQRQVSAAMAEARPKPYKVRLIDFLNALNPSIMQTLAAGTNVFLCDFNAAQFADIQRLTAEPGAEAYIKFKADPEMPYAGGGIRYSGAFALTKELLKP